ncbi:ABC transporter, ATP-binding protein [Sulfurimonas gotlandica GD1]|jgi:putative ABC transport system ATP-binding protein|uniref:ABC transporter, ATP-binding protein n=1 Tax=Sulfurimonas gotlandica (strain DSM 19862 / JCM 16533 / GD1) TaxID=929558 RepID=B6BI90_SULGG|nr:ABC transporter ATP-binding protein [Sulfurimonas gotlandica]EDZ62961.1 lipoprotein-releasing system ATP-binding protein LolD [Sulfurimonas gotlandica GD1]EHP30240.1 ABC transporter, ATP-binding protein [Sulfurimonas gotlandica GD1]
MNLLSAKNLSHTFEYELFSDISMDLDEKESIAIIGISGSGKSTLLHILSTLLTPDSGSVSLFAEDVSQMNKKRLAKIKRDSLGLVFQSHYLFKGFSALENLEVAAILSGQDIDNEILKRLNIYEAINQKVTELSGGQQQRVSIARVLTKQPRILFVDEPTGNLDKLTAHEVMEIFFEYIEKNSAGMVLVTHDEELAFKCKKVYRLENKKLVAVK